MKHNNKKTIFIIIYLFVGIISISGAFFLASTMIKSSESKEIKEELNPFLIQSGPNILLAQNTTDAPGSVPSPEAQELPPPPEPKDEVETKKELIEQIKMNAEQAEAITPANTQSTDTPKENYDLFMEPYNYDPSGRRDPFVQIGTGSAAGVFGSQIRPLLPLERFDLDEIQLVGIIWNVKNPRAMFMDPTKKMYVLGKDERIGRNQGYIAVIREGEVVVVETAEKNGELVYTTKVLRINRSKS